MAVGSGGAGVGCGAGDAGSFLDSDSDSDAGEVDLFDLDPDAGSDELPALSVAGAERAAKRCVV